MQFGSCVINEMEKIKKLVFATNNAHKLQEARQIISDKFEVVSLSDIGCHDDIPETADTLEGNALIKARWVNERYGYDCFADDTGLMVDALNGAPGVYSARYAGEHCSPADNVEKMLNEMAGKEDRKAHFSTVVALILEGETHTFEGSVEGYISKEPHGNGGFGYDPIFIEAESGKCFAEMTADEKNAVSHRGRAMKKLCDFLAMLIVAIVTMFGGFKAEASEWRLHPSYDGQMVSIVETSDYVYFLGAKQLYQKYSNSPAVTTLHGNLFRYSKEGEEIEYLNKTNYLAGNGVKAISYNYDRKFLVVAYDDGTIELVYDNGSTSIVSGFATADASLDKTINDITFDNTTGSIFLATEFGYVEISVSLCEVKTSRNFNLRCNSVAKFDGKLWLATDEGLYYGNPNSFNISDFQKLDSSEAAAKFSTISGSDLYFQLGGINMERIARVVKSGESYAISVLDSGAGLLERGKGVLLASVDNKVKIVDSTGRLHFYYLPTGYNDAYAGSINGREIWVASGRTGISKLKVPEGGGQWTVLKDKFLLNASSAFMCTSMAYHPEYGMLVRNHGYDDGFESLYSCYDLLSGYKDMNWTPLSTTYRAPDMKGLLIDNPFGISIDPNNSNHVYCGSERSGLLRLDMKNPENSIHMSMASDFMGGYGEPGFVVIVPDNEGDVWKEQNVFCQPKFDNEGNMWTAHVYPEKLKEGSSSITELWVWPPKERASSTTANNVKGWKQFRFENMITGGNPKVFTLSTPANKNIVIHFGNNILSSLLVLDHNGTLDNRNDDKVQTIKTFVDQDGNQITLNYVRAFYEDPNTGLVWIAYGSGIFTFDPSEVVKGSTSVRRIKVARNDGTNLADYLLDQVSVNSIVVDSEGRKWFGTTDAGLVCTSADGKEIISTFTTENSELPGNTIYGMSYNPSSNSLMISTDKGLCEYFLSGSSDSSDSQTVRVYPNPVRPDYYGYVTIDKLPSEALVKIVDTNGNLIKDCGLAQNGEVKWDVTNLNIKRVPSGVYYVLASNGPSADSYGEVAKILVVN